jgi:Domain of unknown function (DUF5659)
MNNMKNEFKTSDLYLSAFLQVRGAHLSHIERNNPQRCIFIFDNCDETSLSEWNKGTAETNAVAYTNALQRLKRTLYSGEGA